MFGVHDGPCDLGQGRWMKKLVLSMFFPFVIQGPMVLMRIIRPRVCTSCTSSRCADSRGMSCHKAFFCVVAWRIMEQKHSKQFKTCLPWSARLRTNLPRGTGPEFCQPRLRIVRVSCDGMQLQLGSDNCEPMDNLFWRTGETH